VLQRGDLEAELVRDPEQHEDFVGAIRMRVDEPLAFEDFDERLELKIAPRDRDTFAGLLAASLLQGNSRSSAGAPPTRFTVSLPDAVKRPGDGIQGIALSPDSRSLAISASTEHGGIYLREFAQLESRLLAGTETASDLCFSPDGRSIAYFGLDVHSLRRVTLDGGMPQVIRQQLYEAGFAWSPEGFIAIESPGDHGALSALDLATGRSTPLTRVDKPGGDTNHASPCFLPGARAMFYTVWTGVDGAQGRIDLLDLDTHEQRTVERDATTPRYLPFSEREGALLYHRSDAFWARRFDPRTKQCQGEEVLLIAGGIQLDPNIGEAMLDVSATGTLAYQPRIEGYGQSQLFWVTRDGQEELVTPERLDHQTPSLSADGKLLAFTRGGATPRVYVTDLRPPLDERAPRRVNVEQGISGGCVLSPDGARVVYLSGSNATLKVCVQDLAGDKPPRVIFEGDAMPRSWSRDGLWIAMMGPGPSGAEVKVAPADGSAPARPFVQVKGNAYDPQFSPDGQSLAYVSDEDGLAEVYVAVFPGGSRRAQVTNGGGASPRWSDDGRELYFRKSDEYCVVPVARLPEFSFGTPRILFKGEYDTSFFSNGFLPAPDGRFLLNKPLLPGDRVLRVIVVERFAEEVQTKLATVAAH
jgi:Tol biopolymer transport system component